jgi:hypothetical protein
VVEGDVFKVGFSDGGVWKKWEDGGNEGMKK